MRIKGYRGKDAEWKKMEKVWYACEEAGIGTPKEVDEFFGWEPPSIACGKEVDIKEAITILDADMIEGWNVDISKLPKEVKIIQFYNSY